MDPNRSWVNLMILQIRRAWAEEGSEEFVRMVAEGRIELPTYGL